MVCSFKFVGLNFGWCKYQQAIAKMSSRLYSICDRCHRAFLNECFYCLHLGPIESRSQSVYAGRRRLLVDVLFLLTIALTRWGH